MPIVVVQSEDDVLHCIIRPHEQNDDEKYISDTFEFTNPNKVELLQQIDDMHELVIQIDPEWVGVINMDDAASLIAFLRKFNSIHTVTAEGSNGADVNALKLIDHVFDTVDKKKQMHHVHLFFDGIPFFQRSDEDYAYVARFILQYPVVNMQTTELVLSDFSQNLVWQWMKNNPDNILLRDLHNVSAHDMFGDAQVLRELYGLPNDVKTLWQLVPSLKSTYFHIRTRVDMTLMAPNVEKVEMLVDHCMCKETCELKGAKDMGHCKPWMDELKKMVRECRNVKTLVLMSDVYGLLMTPFESLDEHYLLVLTNTVHAMSLLPSLTHLTCDTGYLMCGLWKMTEFKKLTHLRCDWSSNVPIDVGEAKWEVGPETVRFWVEAQDEHRVQDVKFIGCAMDSSDVERIIQISPQMSCLWIENIQFDSKQNWIRLCQTINESNSLIQLRFDRAYIEYDVEREQANQDYKFVKGTRLLFFDPPQQLFFSREAADNAELVKNMKEWWFAQWNLLSKQASNHRVSTGLDAMRTHYLACMWANRKTTLRDACMQFVLYGEMHADAVKPFKNEQGVWNDVMYTRLRNFLNDSLFVPDSWERILQRLKDEYENKTITQQEYKNRKESIERSIEKLHVLQTIQYGRVVGSGTKREREAYDALHAPPSRIPISTPSRLKRKIQDMSQLTEEEEKIQSSRDASRVGEANGEQEMKDTAADSRAASSAASASSAFASQRQQQQQPMMEEYESLDRTAAARTLVVTNLDPALGVDESDIRGILDPDKTNIIQSVAIQYNFRGQPTGRVHVTFFRREDAMRVADDYDQAEVNGRPMYIQFLST